MFDMETRNQGTKINICRAEGIMSTSLSSYNETVDLWLCHTCKGVRSSVSLASPQV